MTSTTSALADTLPAPLRQRRPRAWVLAADGAFLTIVGFCQSLLDVLGSFAGQGPLAPYLGGVPLAIGLFEAHGLAMILGVWLLLARRDPPPLRPHVVAAAVHLLLGGANLLWWSTFVKQGMTTVGGAATVIHGMFFVANLVAAAQLALAGSSRPASAHGVGLPILSRR